jgi:DNA polymerase-3 subunit gamma/tau
MPVEESAIRDRLRQIAQRENVEIADNALVLLSRRAAGSLRDSQSLLEQLLAVGTAPITLDQVHRFLGTADSGVVGQLVEHLIARDAPAAISAAHTSFRAGVDAGQLAAQLVGFFRDCLAASVGCGDDLLLHAAPDQFDLVRKIGTQAGLEHCLAIAQIMDESLTRMRSSSHPQVLLEIALIRVCRIENLQAISDLVEQLRREPSGPATNATSSGGREAIGRAKPVSSDSAVASKPPSAPDSKKNEPISLESAYVKAGEPAPAAAPLETSRRDEPHSNPTVDEINAESLPVIWKRALNLLGDTTADMAGKYRRLEWHPDGHIVATLSEQFHRYCSLPERKSKVEKVLSEIVGRTIRVEFVASSAPELAASPPPVSRLKQMRDSSREPRVRAAIDIFDAAVTDVLAARPVTEPRGVAADESIRSGGEFDA